MRLFSIIYYVYNTMAWYVLGQRRGCREDLYDLRIELYDLRMLFHKKAVILPSEAPECNLTQKILRT